MVVRRKKKQTKTSGARSARKHVRSRQIMTNPGNRSFTRNHMVVAPIFHDKLGVTLGGTFTAGMAAQGYINVSGSSLHLPFNSTLTAANHSVNTYSHTAYSPGSYSTVQPQGFSTICSLTGLYSRYRVISSKIFVQMQPQSVNDSLIVVITTATVGVPPNTTIFSAGETPYASKLKWLLYTNESAITLTNKRTTMEVYGVSKAGVLEDDHYAGSYNTSPVSEWVWNIVFQQSSNTVSNFIIPFVIRVEYDVEFYAPNTGGLSDV